MMTVANRQEGDLRRSAMEHGAPFLVWAEETLLLGLVRAGLARRYRLIVFAGRRCTQSEGSQPDELPLGGRSDG